MFLFRSFKVVSSFALAAGCALVPAAATASNDAFPEGVVKIVVPFPAGSITDLLARVVAEELQKKTPKATITVENRAGALGQIASRFVAAAKPDGSTVLLSSTATHASGPALLTRPGYDALKDFSHVARLSGFQWMLVCDPAQCSTPDRFVAQAKAQGEALSYGYGTTTAQVGGSALTALFGLKAVGVSYKGAGPALTDVAGGRISYMVVDVGAAAPLVKSGRIKGMAVTSSKRSALLPDVPTFTEAGFPSFEFSGWAGISAPAQTPPGVVAAWSSKLVEIMNDEKVRTRLTNIGIDPAPLPAQQFERFVESDLKLWATRVKAAGITPE